MSKAKKADAKAKKAPVVDDATPIEMYAYIQDGKLKHLTFNFA